MGPGNCVAFLQRCLEIRLLGPFQHFIFIEPQLGSLGDEDGFGCRDARVASCWDGRNGWKSWGTLSGYTTKEHSSRNVTLEDCYERN